MDSIVADQIGAQPFEIHRYAVGIQYADSADFIAASRARAVLSEITKRICADVSVLPGNLELLLSDLLQLNWSRVHITLLRFVAVAR